MLKVRVSQYRRYAQETKEAADKMPSGSARDAMLEFAKFWTELADELEEKLKKDQPK